MPVYRRKWKDKKTGEIRLGSYYFKFDVDGVVYKQTVKTARTKKQAEEAERQARQDVHDGVYGIKNKKQLFSTFVKEVYLPHVEQHNRSQETYSLHTKILCDYFQGRTLGQISHLAVETFKRDRLKVRVKGDKPRQPRSVNSELTTLSGIFSLAVKHRLIRENPCSRVRRLDAEEGPCRRISQEEEEALLIGAESDYAYLKPMIQIALWTGFRQGELIALAKPAIDFARNRIFVINPKWKKDKRKTEGNPVSQKVRELLLELCREAKGDLLFTDQNGEKLDRGNVLGAFRRSCERAEITGLRFHDLRHEYGSRLGDADVNLKKIARLMGHSTTKQTERYVHPEEESLLAATEIAARPRIVPERVLEAERKVG
ncbi:MAG TPA: site-specific integrase [Pyrinomonadaceae bacterium]|jgi:integrase